MGVAAGFAGRRGELRAVTSTLTGSAEGAALLVMGEAGIGKSRLVAAAAAVAARDEVTVLQGWCLPLSGGLPFLPMIDALHGMAATDSGQLLKGALADCPTFVRGELARLLPEFDEAGASSSTGSDDGWRRQRLLEALRQLIRAAAQLRRLAILIEDLHWADRATLELLEYLLAPGARDRSPPRDHLPD